MRGALTVCPEDEPALHDQPARVPRPDPTRTPSTKPPMEAPAMPRTTVTTKRPGSAPGTIRRASGTAMLPRLPS
jgi:hypothetical protein